MIASRWLVLMRTHGKTKLVVARDDISSVYQAPEGDRYVAVVSMKNGDHFSVEEPLDDVQRWVVGEGRE
jgi:hypothetical protein